METIRVNFFSLCLLSVLFFVGCSKQKDEVKEKKLKEDKPVAETSGPQVTLEYQDIERPVINIIYDESKETLKKYYDIPHIKEFYDGLKMSYSDTDSIYFPNELSSLSYDELRLLRNEIFARNGYLFNDGFLRGYFNCFKWYMPIFDVDSFKVSLNHQEQKRINIILNEEKERKKQQTVKYDGLHIYNADLVINFKQFINIPSVVRNNLKEKNFSIIPAKRPMPFYVYDKNAYQYIPHYITTDLYLFILHKYFSRFIEKLDENYMYNALFGLLNKTDQELKKLVLETTSTTFLEALEWAQMYNALAIYALVNNQVSVPGKYSSMFECEKQNIDKCTGNPSFIIDEFVDYTELKPRGHYTKSKLLQNYFKCFKWISLNGIDLDDDEQFRGIIVFAYLIKNNREIYNLYQHYIKTIEKLAGQEDNLSLSDIITVLPGENLANILSFNQINDIRDQLKMLNKEKIKKVFGVSFKTSERNKFRLYFLSSTYSISGEIFSKLVHI